MTETSKFHTLYYSRNRELVIDVNIETKEISVLHDLKIEEVPKLRLRAINTLREKLPELDEIIRTYAPGAKTRKQAEADREMYMKAIQSIESLWPEDKFGPEPPCADRVISE